MLRDYKVNLLSDIGFYFSVIIMSNYCRDIHVL